MRRILIAALLVLLFGYSAPAAHAQDQNCDDITTTFPTGWSVLVGTINGNAVYGGDATEKGDPAKEASVEQFFAPKAISAFKVDYLYFGTGDVNPFVLSATLYLNGQAVDNRTFSYTPILSSGWTTGLMVGFSNVMADHVVIKVYHWSDGDHGGNLVGLRVDAVCGFGGVTPIPSDTAVLDTNTPHPTSTATTTSTPVHTATPTATVNTPTPTITLTPSPTITPGGPTLTALPTSSTIPSSTAPALAVAKGLFSTVAPPKICGDVIDPCGALPFPVPVFSTLALASPTYIASITPGGGYTTATASGTTTGTPGTGTPGTGTPGTGTPGTGTPSGTSTNTGGSNAIQDFGTRVASIATNLPNNPDIHGPGGSTLDIVNGASEIGSFIGNFWGIARGLQSLFLGRVGTLLAFLLLVAGYIVLMKFLLFIVPVLLAIVRWILRVATMVAGAL